MAKNLLVINVDLRETRVALIEDGIISELHLERASTRSTLGNIVLGKVTRVLPGMQAAFIDIGQERAAFLHVEDLIRPDDFEAYMGGGKRPDQDENYDEIDRAPENAAFAARPEATRASDESARADEASTTHANGLGAPAEDMDEIAGGDSEDGDGEPDDGSEADSEGVADEEGDTFEADAVAAAVAAQDAAVAEAEARADALSVQNAAAGDWADRTPSAELAPTSIDFGPEQGQRAPMMESSSGERLGLGDVSSAGASGTIGAVAATAQTRTTRPDVPQGQKLGRAEQGRAEGPSFRTKQRGRSARQHGLKRNGRGKNLGRRNGQQRDTSRLSRSTPIREVVREGQEVIVQVSKEPIGTKGARVTSHVSLPGRYVVYMPTIDQVGISKRIGSEKERARLREAIESIKPPTGGLIVRTVAEGLTKKQLKADVGYLVRLWEDVAKKREASGKAPAMLYQELDLVLKTARDLFTDEIGQIVIDDREQFQRLVRFVEMFMPERVKDIVLYSGDEPIFDAYGIEDEISRALSRKVPLPSGGYLIIDQAEALTAIDVNTGRYVGKGSKDLEDTLLKTNLEAVEEIAYQLRFRNLGGLIVLDLIDMERASNREKVRRRLEELLQKDKAKTTLNRISDLGLIEMTRKRTRESLGRLLHEPCFYCDGTGQLQSKQTVVYEILRQIRRDRAFLPGYSVLVNAHPAVIDLMKGEEREAVQEAERRFMRRIELVPRKEYHLEQFDLAGK
jgi:ribonuclease G